MKKGTTTITVGLDVHQDAITACWLRGTAGKRRLARSRMTLARSASSSGGSAPRGSSRCATVGARDTHRARLRGRSQVIASSQRFDDPAAQRTFDEYLAQLDFGVDRLRALDRELEALAEQSPWQPLVARLRCLRGIKDPVRPHPAGRDPGLPPLPLPARTDELRWPDAQSSRLRRHRTPRPHHQDRQRPRAANPRRSRRALPSPAHQAGAVRARAQGQPEAIRAEPLEAQHRLHRRYWRLVGRGKLPQVAAVAVGRELGGFIWALLVKPAPLPGTTPGLRVAA